MKRRDIERLRKKVAGFKEYDVSYSLGLFGNFDGGGLCLETIKAIIPPEGYQFVDENGNVINVTKIILEKKKKEYPKTFDKCCHIVQTAFVCDVRLHKGKYYDIFRALAKLIVCRDAYWKIAGEEMGLDGPWEPDSFHQVFSIGRISGTLIGKALRHNGKTAVLEFPTAEMRDAFYENFKNLIEQCKELL